MKRAVILWCLYDPDVKKFMYERFKDCAPKEFSSYNRGEGQQLVFEPDSPELQEALSWARYYKQNFTLFNEVYYTKQELDQHPFFHVRLSDPLAAEYKHPRDYGTKYHACPHCDFSFQREGDLLVNGTLLRRRDIGFLDQELFVSGEMKQLIEEAQLTGLEFVPEIKEYRGRLMPTYYVANVKNILPPVSISTWLSPSPSFKCDHGTLYCHSDLQYEKEKLANANDFNLTFEHYNNDRTRFLVVSQRARQVFRKHGIRLQYFPVAVLDHTPCVTYSQK